MKPGLNISRGANGLRIIEIGTSIIDCRFEVAEVASGKQCKIVDDTGGEVGTALIDTPQPAESEAARANRQPRGKQPPRNETIDDWIEAGRRLGHGVLGYIKASLGIDKASASIISKRLAICHACPHITSCTEKSKEQCCGPMKNVLKARSKTCGCRIDKKTKLAGEQCPLENW